MTAYGVPRFPCLSKDTEALGVTNPPGLPHPPGQGEVMCLSPDPEVLQIHSWREAKRRVLVGGSYGGNIVSKTRTEQEG